MKLKWIALLLLLFIVSGCGPIIGQLMKVSEGIKEFTVVSGEIHDVKEGSNILVAGPFDLSEGAYYIARGDEAAMFSEKFIRHKIFRSQLFFAPRYGNVSPGATNALLKEKDPKTLQSELGLADPPSFSFSGPYCTAIPLSLRPAVS